MLSQISEPGKACFKCGETKPLDQFYRHPKMADGHLGKCRDCTKADAKRHRASNPEYYQTYHAEKYQTDRLRIRQRQAVYAQTEACRASMRESGRRWIARNGEKRRAHLLLASALRAGKLEKPKACTQCGGAGRIHGHHDDYSQPLTVIWCCATCHSALHRKQAA